MTTEKIRCKWCLGFDDYIKYHDEEWGKPVHDDRIHFEFLVLESAQAGLSWSTILKKRQGYKESFADFDPEEVAQYTEGMIMELKEFKGIIRNEAKIRASVNNAIQFLKLQKEFGSFDKYIWGFVGGKPIVNQWKDYKTAPATTPESDALSKDLKKRGFKFLGSTTIYAHMQAVGLVNDHVIDCFRYKEVMK
jgi:DNA-3-methyladenine glycosylase I